MLLISEASLLRAPVVQPTAALPVVKAAVGTMLGAAIPPGVMDLVAAWWPSLLVMFSLLILGGVLNYAGLRRCFGFAPIDALLCSMPGGISEMILLGDQAGADQRRVAIVHRTVACQRKPAPASRRLSGAHSGRPPTAVYLMVRSELPRSPVAPIPLTRAC